MKFKYIALASGLFLTGSQAQTSANTHLDRINKFGNELRKYADHIKQTYESLKRTKISLKQSSLISPQIASQLESRLEELFIGDILSILNTRIANNIKQYLENIKDHPSGDIITSLLESLYGSIKKLYDESSIKFKDTDLENLDSTINTIVHAINETAMLIQGVINNIENLWSIQLNQDKISQ